MTYLLFNTHQLKIRNIQTHKNKIYNIFIQIWLYLVVNFVCWAVDKDWKSSGSSSYSPYFQTIFLRTKLFWFVFCVAKNDFCGRFTKLLQCNIVVAWPVILILTGVPVTPVNTLVAKKCFYPFCGKRERKCFFACSKRVCMGFLFIKLTHIGWYLPIWV